MKKKISWLLVIALLLNCFLPIRVSKAAEPTEVELSLGTNSGAQDTRTRYIVNITFDGQEQLSQIGDISNQTVRINGEEKQVTWSGWGEGETQTTDHYSLCATYEACSRVGFRKDSEMNEIIYITVPKGSVIGDYKVKSDFHVKITGAGMSGTSACKIEEVEEVPTDYYLASWNYNSNAVFPRWNKIGISTDGWQSSSQTVYIDDTAYSVKWEGNKSYYYFTLNYSTLGVTALSNLGEHTIRIPKGTEVGDMKLERDYYIQSVKVGDTYKLIEMKPSEKNVCVSDGGYQDNNKRYVIRLKPTDTDVKLTEIKEISGNVQINGKEQSVTWGGYSSADGSAPADYYLIINYSQTKSSNAQANNYVQAHTYVTIPKGTVVGSLTFNDDVHIRICGGGITSDDYKIEEIDALPDGYYYGLWTYNDTSKLLYPYFYSFRSTEVAWQAEQQTIYIDNIAKTVRWEGNGTYFYFPLSYEDLGGTSRSELSTHRIRIPSGNPIGAMNLSEDIYLKTVEKNGTYILVQTTADDQPAETHTDVTLTNDTINGTEDLARIALNATADTLKVGDYIATQFKTGGIYRNGELLTTAKLQKPWDNYYYIDLSEVTDLKTGDVITLDGELCVDATYVKYSKISFRRNANGSFSQYDETAEAIEDKTQELGKLYVNLDKQSSYTIPSAPLAKNCAVTVKVDDTTVTDMTLAKAGIYQVTRTMENIEMAKIVSSVGTITYKQTIQLFHTGDANLDGRVSAADLIRIKKNLVASEDVVAGANDLDFDGECTREDASWMSKLLVGKSTAKELLAKDQSVVIGAISDTHYQKTGRDAQSRINTRKALNYYKSQNVDVIIFNGDITDLGQEIEYQKLVADITAVYPDSTARPQMIFTGDNHEWWDAWTVNGHTPTQTFTQTQERFVQQLKSLRGENTSTNTHEEIAGYHFIGVTSDGMDGGNATYSDTTIAWVTEELKKAAAADITGKQPIFLAIHQAPKNTVIFSDGDDHYKCDAMDNLLKQYPQLVVITSHTHAPLQDERSIHQKEYTTLNTASTYYAGGMSSYTNIEATLMDVKYQFGQCLVIRAQENAVDVERVDVYHDEIIKDNWRFKTSNRASDYTQYTDSRKDTNQAPSVVDSSMITATRSEDKKSTVLTFTSATDDDYVNHYLISVYQEGTETPVVTYKYNTFYFLGLNRIPSSCSYTIKNLDPSMNYTFGVVAVDTWGAKSGDMSETYSILTDTATIFGTPY